MRPWLIVALVAAGGSFMITPAAWAVPITIVDDEGADDEPGQKDLNQLTVEFEPATQDIDLEVSWHWDETSMSGKNTADACSLFDTDNDGNANYSMCVVWGGDAVHVSTLLYECNDTAADRCNSGTEPVALPDEEGVSSCQVELAPDTFPATHGIDAEDVRATCLIDLGNISGSSAFLVNVCSYPSQQPNSDPSDCVVNPDSGFLTLVKEADPDDLAIDFDFQVAPGATDGSTKFSIAGSGTRRLIPMAAGTISVQEVLTDSTYLLHDAYCKRSDGTETGGDLDPNSQTVSGVEIQVGRETVCSFHNMIAEPPAGSVNLVKEVINDNGGNATADAFTLSADRKQDGDYPSCLEGFSGNPTPEGSSRGAVSGELSATAYYRFDCSYLLSETGPPGYTQQSINCDAGTLSGNELTLLEADVESPVTCVIVNDDDAPSLTLVKEVINDNGGTAVPGDWTLTAAGYDAGSPDAGTYDLSESGPDDYTQTSLTCSNSGDAEVSSVTLGLGEDVTCTFVYDDDAPSLTLVKEVINDNGGTALASDWTLTAAGYDAASPQTGTYDLSGWGPDNYTQISLTCSNSGDAEVSSVTLGLGEDVTCTFLYDDDAPSLTLVKQVINDNGGTAVASDWTLTAAGYDAGSPDAGTYDLSESGPANYTQTSLTCSNSGDAEVSSVTLGLGEDVTCTFVNDDDAPSLTLVKEVINDNGGTAEAGDWTLTAAGYDAASPQTGTYDLSESGPDNYTQTSLTCDNAEGQVSSVTLGLGEDVTCTFVNDDDAPSLTLVKEVTNDNGGTAEAGEWTLTATGYDAASPDAGTYDLSESGPDNYTQTSLTCSNSGDAEVSSVTLGLGEDVTCTFVNDDDAPSLTLVTEVINDNGGTAEAGEWTLTAAGYDASNPQTGTYTLSEWGPDNYTQTSLTCDNAVGQVSSVTLGLGEDVTCTLVNNDAAPGLTLVKEVINDNGGTALASAWTLSAAGYDANNPQAGTYELSESGPAGYSLTSLTCSNSGDAQVASVTLYPGEDVTCTFVNDDDAPNLILVKEVINDNGGTELASAWTLSAAAYNADNPQTGTYALSESGPDGYERTSLTCSNSGDQQVTSVTLGLGESVTCTFVNNDIAPTITLVKRLLPSSDPGKFNLLIDGIVQEYAVGDGGATPAVAVTAGLAHKAHETDADGGPIVGYVPSYEGDCDSNGMIANPALGQHYTCTVTNRAISLKIEKQVSNSADGPWSDSMQVFVGSQVWYRFVVVNDGAVAMQNIQVTDPLLAELLGDGYPADHVFCEVSHLPHEDPDNVYACDVVGPVTAGFTPDGGSVNVALVEGYVDPEDHDDPNDPYVPYEPYVPNPDEEGPTSEDDDQAQYDGEFWAFTPGFWKNHHRRKDAWGWTSYTTKHKVGEVFGSTNLGENSASRKKYSKRSFSELTLLEALQLQGGSTVEGAMETLLRHGVTALLNASFHEKLDVTPDHPKAWYCEVVPTYFEGTLKLPYGVEVEMLCGSNGIVYYPLSLESVRRLVDWALDSGDRATMLEVAAGLDRYNNGIHYVDWNWPTNQY
jgi:uncharacterized repeat protein (TIGR01451 family)